MQKTVTYNLTENFIENLAKFFEENFMDKGEDISRFAFIFGGRRPSLFFKKELSKRTKKGFFPPHFFSVDEFAEYIVNKKERFSRISDLDACFIIYNLIQRTSPDILKGRESFSQFLPWAREILYFIEQVDLEDISVESLKNIQEKAALGYDVPEDVNRLLKGIISLRDDYHAILKENKTYSRGLVYLLAGRYIKDVDFKEFNHILFCGFFYLHKTEQDIMKSIYDKEKTVLFFQGNESEWSVLKKVSHNLGLSIEAEDIQRPRYNLSLKGGFDIHSEVCLAREVLKKIKKLDKTVIVLPEPDSLIPLLSEISTLASDFNVSMGYPLKRSSLYSLFECIFKAQETRKGDEYYAKDYLKVLSHPLIKNLKIFPDYSVTRVLIHKIEEILAGIEETPLGGSLFVSLDSIQHSEDLYPLAINTMRTMALEVTEDELKIALQELHNILFAAWENIKNFHEFTLSLERFLDVLVNKGPLGNYPLNLKMAERLFSINEELKNSSFSKEQFPGEDIFKIFDNKLSNEVISFSGSPLKGLQVLGLLETRSLNFDNVIVIDVNETVLPKLKVYEPLIPREVMISLGLNRLEKEEEIQRYQFRRLISSARNVYLIYQKRDDKEKSRFMEELIWERQKEKNSLDVLSIPQASFNVKVLTGRLEIEKNQDVLKFLKECKYSASRINTYMQCPLRFYYQYVLRLKEKEDLLEEPEGTDMGNFIHELLKETFSVFIGKKPCVDENFRQGFFAVLKKKFEGEFQKRMKSDAFLIKEILDFRLEKFLNNEMQRDVREIICLEKPFEDKIRLGCGTFKFKAIIDRIDKLSDGGILILDYKTGSTDIMPQDIEKIESEGFNRESFKKTIKSFQLPLYLYFVDKIYKDKKIDAAIYSIRDAGGNSCLKELIKDRHSEKGKIMEVYLKALDSILNDILNPDIPFKADEEDPRRCATCPFFYLCR